MNDNELLQIFGLNLKFQRLKRKISQEQLAEALSLSSVYISNVEGGKHNISLVNALKFCKYFGTSIENLIIEK